jgi:hypothetical protein
MIQGTHMNNELALARSSKLLKKIQNEIICLLYEADINSPYHYTLKTDASLLLGTAKLLQRLKREKPAPESSRKYSREVDVNYYPALEEIIIHVSGAATSDDHEQYSQSMEDAYFSVENYICNLKKRAVTHRDKGIRRNSGGKTQGC